MSLLEEIVAQKKKEISNHRDQSPVFKLELEPGFTRKTYSLKAALLDKNSSGVIAEFKRRSPSRGDILPGASVSQVTTGYVKAGAAALSILTDKKYFSGCKNDLLEARALNKVPILRKEFIIDEYQIIEAKAFGADAVLLIVRILSLEQLKALSLFAKSIGLEVLCEVHQQSELDLALSADIDLIGINSRDLDTLEINTDTFERLGNFVPHTIPKVAESGIKDPLFARQLKEGGYSGFLVGESFLASDQSEAACARFVAELRRIN